MENFKLAKIADRLQSMEETIIWRILDRIQYKRNSAIYSTDDIFAKILSPINNAHKEFALNADGRVNLSGEIKEKYQSFLDISCEAGDDNEYISAAESDFNVLRAVTKRIYYGAFYVAESKFLSSPKKYAEAIKLCDTAAIISMLTRRDVEKKIISRVQEKCKKIQAVYTSKLRRKIDPRLIGDFYKNTIIPMTKDGELLYLFRRDENETD